MKTIYDIALEDLEEEESTPTDSRLAAKEFIEKTILEKVFKKNQLTSFITCITIVCLDEEFL